MIDIYKTYTADVVRWINKVKSESDTHRWLFLHERPDRIHALLSENADGMAVNAKLLLEVWISVKNPTFNQGAWELMFRRYKNDLQDTLASLPDKLIIYRGGIKKMALFWTLNHDKAIWFAKRFGDGVPVHQIVINKDQAFAFTNERKEEEVIVV